MAQPAPAGQGDAGDAGPRVRGLWSTRGVVLGAGGVSAAVAAAALGEPDLLRLGLFVAVLPLVSLAWTLGVGTRGVRDLQVDRHADPARVGRGTPVTVHLRLVRPARTGADGATRPGPRRALTRGTVLAEDALPRGVSRRAAPPRLVLLGGDDTAEAAYTFVPLRRGILQLGPTVVRVESPLGLCDRRVELPGTSELVVTPEIVPLPVSDVLLRPPPVGEGRRRRAGTATSEDASVRPYRRGDDLRMVHWRSTARRGELQVREGQDLRVPRALLVVDATRPSGPGGAATTAFEVAIDLAASVAVHLHDVGHDVDLTVVGDASPPARRASVAEILARLADLDASRPGPEGAQGPDGPRGAHGAGGAGGSGGAADVTILCTHAASRSAALADALPPVSARSAAVALVADAAAESPPHAADPPAAGSDRTDLDALLTARGWVVQHVASARDLPDHWRDALDRAAAVTGSR